jgi:cytochrome c oxidase assembly protein subunit 15
VRARYLSGTLRGLFVTLLVAILAQASLGVATLMTGVPLALAILHQAGAVIVLTTAVVLAWRTRRA